MDSDRRAKCFRLYTYREDGKQREENIPLSTLQHFQKHYKDKTITREDIFHYVYALLHHPDTAPRYAENLKRDCRASRFRARRPISTPSPRPAGSWSIYT